MCTTQLEFPNGNTIASFKLASNTTAVLQDRKRNVNEFQKHYPKFVDGDNLQQRKN